MGSENKRYNKTRFLDNFKEQFPVVTKCSLHVFNDKHKFHCTICNLNNSLARGGSNDITGNAEKSGHTKRA